MNCNEIRDNLSLYMDDELSEEERKLIENHLIDCPQCSKELKEYKKIIQLLNDLPNEEPPEGYCKRLHKKLLSAAAETQELEKEDAGNIVEIPKRKRVNRWVKYGSLAAAFVMIFIVAGLNSGLNMKSSENKMQMAYDSSSPAEAAPQAPQALPNMGEYGDVATEEFTANLESLRGDDKDKVGIMSTTEQRELKIIKSGNMYVQIKDYDVFIGDINSKVQEFGGFIENNSTEVYQVYENDKLMRGSLKIRVPQEYFYEFLSYLENSTDVRRKNTNEKDVTKEYYEKDNKVRNLEIQEQNLRDLFEKANTVEEMLQIENELRRVRTEIDSLNISLADINDRASMSSIDLQVDEVREINFTLKSEKGVWERAREGFIYTVNSIVRGIGNLIVNIVSLSPVLIPVIIIFVVLLFKIKKYWKKKL